MNESRSVCCFLITVFSLVFLLFGACAAGPAGAGILSDPEYRQPVLDAMSSEISRSMERLTIGENEPPYFIAYSLRETEGYDLQSRYGAIFRDEHSRSGLLNVEVRVGSYELDNSKASRQGFFGRRGQATYISRKDAPLEKDLTALKAAFWLSTDEKYKEALSDYLRMQGEGVYKPEEEKADSFSREEPVVFYQEPVDFEMDRDKWKKDLRRAGHLFRSSPKIFDNLIRMNARKETRYITNSEGTRLITEEVLFSLNISAVSRAEDGMLLTHGRTFYGRKQEDLPGGDVLDAEVEKIIKEILALRTAPVIDPVTGPALFSPQAAGVLFHEAVGHRLEGERQDDDDSGRTFKGQVGRRIIPEFLTIYDDPTLEDWEGVPLNGAYLYDDQGVKSRRVDLVEKGVLKGYLLSRTPIKDFKPQSTGHGRAQGNRTPVARMGNFIVEPVKEDSSVVEDMDSLEKLLIEEARRQGSEYALVIEDVTGGDTNVSIWGYQAFRGVPNIVYRINVETGEKELVRGVEIVGTPLTVVNRISAISRETGVFNGYCGAESGFIPVSTVSPGALITEIELQRQRRDVEREPVLSPPWE